MDVRAIKIDDTGSVLVRDNNSGMELWMDVYKDSSGELQSDWNKYIFFMNYPEDVKIKEFQEDCWNFICFTEEAISYAESKEFNY